MQNEWFIEAIIAEDKKQTIWEIIFFNKHKYINK